MSFAKILIAAAAATMVVSPVMAASTDSAAKLSLAPSLKSVRAAASTAKKSKITHGATIAIIVIAVGAAIGGIVAGTTGASSR